MAKLTTNSKVFTSETIALLNKASADTAVALATACLDGAKVGITRDKFLTELRKVSQIPCNTAAASAGLRAAAADEATVTSVATAITAQYEKDRVAAIARRKAAKKTPNTDAPNTDAPNTDAPNTDAPNTDAPNTDAPNTDAPNTDAPNTDAPNTDAVPTLAQLEIRKAALLAELKEIDDQIRAMKAAAAAAASTGMGDSSVAAS